MLEETPPTPNPPSPEPAPKPSEPVVSDPEAPPIPEPAKPGDPIPDFGLADPRKMPGPEILGDVAQANSVERD
ncbi:MAG: hypothetical protein ACJ8C4_10265 [Gemmataceae bacterium]